MHSRRASPFSLLILSSLYDICRRPWFGSILRSDPATKGLRCRVRHRCCEYAWARKAAVFRHSPMPSCESLFEERCEPWWILVFDLWFGFYTQSFFLRQTHSVTPSRQGQRPRLSHLAATHCDAECLVTYSYHEANDSCGSCCRGGAGRAHLALPIALCG